MAMAMNVAPNGLPTLRKWPMAGCDGSIEPMFVFRRKSWVTAIPMLANERDVRSHARNVRSNKLLAQ